MTAVLQGPLHPTMVPCSSEHHPGQDSRAPEPKGSHMEEGMVGQGDRARCAVPGVQGQVCRARCAVPGTGDGGWLPSAV